MLSNGNANSLVAAATETVNFGNTGIIKALGLRIHLPLSCRQLERVRRLLYRWFKRHQ